MHSAEGLSNCFLEHIVTIGHSGADSLPGDDVTMLTESQKYGE